MIDNPFFKRTLEALERGADEVDNLRRQNELLSVRLEMVHIMHEITNPGRSQVMGHRGGMHPDASYILRNLAAAHDEIEKQKAALEQAIADQKGKFQEAQNAAKL